MSPKKIIELRHGSVDSTDNIVILRSYENTKGYFASVQRRKNVSRGTKELLVIGIVGGLLGSVAAHFLAKLIF